MAEIYIENMKLPELLAPAGDLNKAYIAFKYGADAIYCGLPMVSLRTRMNTFTEKDFEEIVSYAKQNNKKVYAVVNGFPHQNSLDVIKKHLEFLNKILVDGVILADAGVLALANKHAPDIEKHLSVQAATLNSEAIKFWQENGVDRIILAREVSLSEIINIHDEVPNMDLEYFIHGSVCMAYSGRCMLSNYATGRDANRGACAHNCRWNYRVYDENGYEVLYNGLSTLEGEKDSRINIHELEKKVYLEEEKRIGEFIPVEEDFHGTHFMSSRDMCMIEKLEDLIKSGVMSLKIEGRNKTNYYLAHVVRAYREALDNIAAGKKFDPQLWEMIHATANRGFFAGFLHGKPDKDGQQYEANRSTSSHLFVGEVISYENNRVYFEVKNRIDLGDEIEFFCPKKSDDFSQKATELIKDNNSQEAVHGGNGTAYMNCDREVEVGTLMKKRV